MNSSAIRLGCLLVVSLSAFAADPLELRLWPGKAPGSENWTVPESLTDRGGGRVATNVSDPTLTAFLPDPAKANGAAVVIAPGGALQALSLDSEGTKVAEWLNSKGIAGFVLKYRLRQQSPGPASAVGDTHSQHFIENGVTGSRIRITFDDREFLARSCGLRPGAQQALTSCSEERSGTSTLSVSASWGSPRAAVCRSEPSSPTNLELQPTS